MKLIIHIGQHRTATSYLQHFCTINEKSLRSQGLNYCQTGRNGNNHSAFALNLPCPKRKQVLEAFFKHKKEFSGLYKTYSGLGLESLSKKLITEIKKSDCNQHLISSESFLEWVEPQLFKEILLSHAIEIQVIAFVRHPKPWIESVYSQVIKDPDLQFSEEFSALPQLFMLDYQDQFAPWIKTFGQKSITFLPFFEHANINTHILSLLNTLSVTPSNQMIWPQEKINASMDRHCINHLRHVNKVHLSVDERLSLNNKLSELSSLFKKQIIYHKWACATLEWNNLYKAYQKTNNDFFNQFHLHELLTQSLDLPNYSITPAINRYKKHIVREQVIAFLKARLSQ